MRNSCPYCEMLENDGPLAGEGPSDKDWIVWRRKHNKEHIKVNQEISEEGK